MRLLTKGQIADLREGLTLAQDLRNDGTRYTAEEDIELVATGFIFLMGVLKELGMLDRCIQLGTEFDERRLRPERSTLVRD